MKDSPADISEGKPLTKRPGGKNKRFFWLFSPEHLTPKTTERVINYCVLFPLWQANPNLEEKSKKEQIFWKRNNIDLIV